MYKMFLSALMPFIFVGHVDAQDIVATKALVDSTNKQIDKAVVARDIGAMRKFYADDFVFTHGTGYVEGKQGWIENIEKPSVRFLSREHDSTTVELHGDIAIVSGKMAIQRQESDKLFKYGLWYVRVYARRDKRWQMISHRTTKEWHD